MAVSQGRKFCSAGGGSEAAGAEAAQQQGSNLGVLGFLIILPGGRGETVHIMGGAFKEGLVHSIH